MTIPFNKPYFSGNELLYIQDAHTRLKLAGDGFYTSKCHAWLETNLLCKSALLTHSCTAALEMCALLLDIKPGDEVIMPSFTFVSTASAFVLRGATPVFVDIDDQTLNIDISRVEKSITSKTKAIVVVHYAGVAHNLDKLLNLANAHNIVLVEDAAQAILSSFKGQPVGSWGHLATLSFHETKNVISGEGGALLINDQRFIDRAKILRDKGTNRQKFLEGQVDKYTWVDLGSSFLPGELTSAFLWAQLENAASINSMRLKAWNYYYTHIRTSVNYRKPRIPSDCSHNAHIFYLIFNNRLKRDHFINYMDSHGVHCVFHYIPLHSSPYGMSIGHHDSPLHITDFVSQGLVRLPLWAGMDDQYELVTDLVNSYNSFEN